MPESPVVARALVKRFGSRTAVAGVDLQVERGGVHGLLGPNGAGKTTLMRMLFGLIRPDGGDLAVFGRRWSTHGVRTLDGVAGFVETPRFYPYLSGRRNLQLMAGLDGVHLSYRVWQVLETVELRERAEDKVGGYSLGMRQRLGVAAALLRDPVLLVLDEPANGLDPAGIRDMRALVRRLGQSGLTVLFSSHNMDEVEEVCDQVTIMSTGSVVYHGDIATLRAKAPDPCERLHTGDDTRAEALAAAHPDLRVQVHPDGGFDVRGPRAALDAFTVELGAAGIAIRALASQETPLEELFFMLTEAPDPATRLPAQGRTR